MINDFSLFILNVIRRIYKKHIIRYKYIKRGKKVIDYAD